ncbi:preprotein translocase subunit SecG [Asticcacaulis sp. EMRT-3]|uniref:preprotein translocase subunit SecG n=1 Tax=Asticcacaulis sp. EMRT-3 TaxID=3040349 RepID=UPI0024AFA9BD|nr:preprotein translocase subunit SecG [Asticcacaulis sp. EMRT-3]MDI7774535.1 preprotein translocase subunit SecG [Asticcacaulis sp. EMRT-3]
MLFGILLTAQIIICLAMGGLILIQQSEGGALGMGGGGGGFMSARGAGNLLTRATGILAFLFFANCIGLTIVGNIHNRVSSAVDQVDTSGLTLTPSTAPQAAAAASSSASMPSLNDLPTGAPVQPQAANQPASKPVTGGLSALPPPVVLPQVKSSQKQVEAAKNAIWESSSSAAHTANASKAPASSAASSSAAR